MCECQRVECAFTSSLRTECDMLVMWYTHCFICPCQLFSVVVVCHDQVRLQVSRGFRCRDS